MKIHILGICGVMTTPLAIALREQGNIVTGSDQDKIYPPFSTELKKHHITVNQPVTFSDIDLFIVGSSFKAFKRCLDEFDFIQKNNLRFISSTQYLADNLIKTNSILVAGTYGKTTITSLVTWILKSAGYKPNYFFGGLAINRIPSIEFSPTDWSIVEADESINGLDTQAKFLYFSVKYLILTSADWEHKESYPTEAANTNSFSHLISKLPSDGVLVFNSRSLSASRLAKKASCKVIPYDFNLKIEHQLLGEHNQENVIAAATFCLSLGVHISTIQKAINSYRGIRRRLEIISQQPLIIDDFAQSPKRISQSIKAITTNFPQKNIRVFFEPHASFLDDPKSLKGFKSAFSIVKEVTISRLHRNPSNLRHVNFADYQDEIGAKAVYLPLYPDVLKYYCQTLKPNEVLVHFSSGGLEGLNLLKMIKRSILK